MLIQLRGFFRSVALGRASALQDLLRLLTLWFRAGARRDVQEAVASGCESISPELWLLVTPQIIARIHSPNIGVRRSVNKLLAQVARSYPQVRCRGQQGSANVA